MNEPFESSHKTAINENQGQKGETQKRGPIIVGTDGSVGAARAVDVASVLAADLNTHLWIAYVMDETSDADLTPIARAENTSKGDIAEAMARRILADTSRRSDANGARKVHICWPEIAPMNSLRRLEMFAHRRPARCRRAHFGSLGWKCVAEARWTFTRHTSRHSLNFCARRRPSVDDI